MNARITPTEVYIGGHEMSAHIAERGITLIPGGDDDFNRLIVEFIVDEVEVAAGVDL